MTNSNSFLIPFFENFLKITMTDKGVTEIQWLESSPPKISPLSPKQKKVAQQILSFVNGGGALKIPLDWDTLKGTAFQKRVWKKMLKIPYGKTRSYGEIAKSLEKPGAARAVGTACGRNPVLLAIPCHRVVGSNGLGGFSGGGLSVKRKLLSLEGSH